MAAPADMTPLDTSGRFLLNKSLSDDTDEILRLQGVSWFKRKAIAAFSLTLRIKHYKDDDGVEHIDIDQTLSGGIPGTSENRILNWEDHYESDHVFGPTVGRNRRSRVEDIEDLFLKEGWTDDTIEHGVVESYAASDTPKSGTTWVALQTWGFQVKDGVRRYARRVRFTGPKGEIVEAHMYYDYLGSL